MDRENWIEQMSESDTVRFGNESEQMTVTIKAPGPPHFHDLEPFLIVAVQQFVAQLPCWVLVRQLERV